MLGQKISELERETFAGRLLKKAALALKEKDYGDVLSLTNTVSEFYDFIELDLLATMNNMRKPACWALLEFELEDAEKNFASKNYDDLPDNIRCIRQYCEELRVPVPVTVRCYTGRLGRIKLEEIVKRVTKKAE